MSTTAKENIANCPEWCYSINNVTNDLTIIKAGELGFYKANYHMLRLKNEGESNDQFADRLNLEKGINKGTREAMEAGSMWGWDVPGANPLHYNEDGSFKKEFLNQKR